MDLLHPVQQGGDQAGEPAGLHQLLAQQVAQPGYLDPPGS